MLRLESEWLGERLAHIPDNDLFPLLDVGSSTLEYRTRTQPYIERNIFAPLRARGGTVYHLDMKSDPGVDIVGNLEDPAFRGRVSQMHVRSVLIASLLQYIRGHRQVCNMVMAALPAGGFLFVSGPYSHPHDADPIDTMFRPSIAEIHGYFPGTRSTARLSMGAIGEIGPLPSVGDARWDGHWSGCLSRFIVRRNGGRWRARARIFLGISPRLPSCWSRNRAAARAIRCRSISAASGRASRRLSPRSRPASRPVRAVAATLLLRANGPIGASQEKRAVMH